jgi:hypothetical protein
MDADCTCAACTAYRAEPNPELANALKCFDELATAAGRKYEELRAETLAWAEIAQDLWSLCCEGAMKGASADVAWEASRKRAGDRFHAALVKLHAPTAAAAPPAEATP